MLDCVISMQKKFIGTKSLTEARKDNLSEHLGTTYNSNKFENAKILQNPEIFIPSGSNWNGLIIHFEDNRHLLK